MTEELRWLHISDLHFGRSRPSSRSEILGALCKSVQQEVADGEIIDIIFVTGDIGNTGSTSEYLDASLFFDELLRAAGLDRSRLFVVPGNHDVDRSEGEGLVRTLTSDELSERYFTKSGEKIHIRQKFHAFKAWYDEYFSGIREFTASSTFQNYETVSIRDTTVGVLLGNSATFCIGEDDHEKLWLGAHCLRSAMSTAEGVHAAIKFALLHHPIDWLHPAEQLSVAAKLNAHQHIVLRGHLHETVTENARGSLGEGLQLAAGAAYQTLEWPNRFMFCRFIDDTITVKPMRYEAKPHGVWTLDTSVYPREPGYLGQHTVPGKSTSKLLRSVVSPTAEQQEFERDLFVGHDEKPIHVEPRLMDKPHDQRALDDDTSGKITIAEIIDGDYSILIESRPEHGGTTLFRQLQARFASDGRWNISSGTAGALPTYRKKLEEHFKISETEKLNSRIVLLDDFDVELHERVAKEILSIPSVARIIAISRCNPGRPTLSDSKVWSHGTKVIYLWPISRSDVRYIASRIIDSGDGDVISHLVQRAYTDLLALCIPLTPLNTIMYAKIAHHDGEFLPLNRVDIVDKYISNLLHRPSDSFYYSFSAKNKKDILSAFSYHLFIKGMSDFTVRDWRAFCSTYRRDTLTDFDDDTLLEELKLSRIVVSYGRAIYFTYSFYFSYFLGRYIVGRRDLIDSFIDSDAIFTIDSIVEVVSGLSADNERLLSSLSDRLGSDLNAFSEKYFSADFDPMIKALWPDNSQEKKALWDPIEKSLEEGPHQGPELDRLKSSIQSETKTADQEVIYRKYAAFEGRMASAAMLLSEALRNSDSVSGDSKKRAVRLLHRFHLVMFQMSALLAPVIAEHKYVQWGGVAFVNNNAEKRESSEERNREITRVLVTSSIVIAHMAGSQYGMKKLGEVFKAVSGEEADSGYLSLVNVSCIVYSKPPGWSEKLTSIIKNVGRNEYYLNAILRVLMNDFKNEINTSASRDVLKRLISTIHAKRSVNKEAPNFRVVDRVRIALEKRGEFGPSQDASDPT